MPSAINPRELPIHEPSGTTTLRCVNVDTNTYKWWQVEWWGELYITTTWGRIGAAPERAAWKGAGKGAAVTKIRAKIKSGYREVEASELLLPSRLNGPSSVLLLNLDFTTPERVDRLETLLNSAINTDGSAFLNAFLSEAPIHWRGEIAAADVRRYLRHNATSIREFFAKARSGQLIAAGRTSFILLESPDSTPAPAPTRIMPARAILDDWGDE
jgi:predicted DNA-binding WGR domain protein